jgi:hypothetical protein
MMKKLAFDPPGRIAEAISLIIEYLDANVEVISYITI